MFIYKCIVVFLGIYLTYNFTIKNKKKNRSVRLNAINVKY